LGKQKKIVYIFKQVVIIEEQRNNQNEQTNFSQVYHQTPCVYEINTKPQAVRTSNNNILASTSSLDTKPHHVHLHISNNTHIPFMPTYQYKQPLGIWNNNKQDGDLINKYGKEKTELRENTKIYMKTPYRENHGLRRDESTMKWSNTRGGSQQMRGGFKSPPQSLFYWWILMIKLPLSQSP
jgi:hypothetical protein